MNFKIPKFKTIFEVAENIEVVVPPGEQPYVQQYVYNEDQLKITGKGLDVLKSERFENSYRRGMSTDHKISRPKGSGLDIGIRYRTYINVWAAERAKNLPGDFAEFGVNTGITALAICDYIGLGGIGSKKFYLFDTFCGIPEDSASEVELANAKSKNSRFYEECYESVRSTFSPFPCVELVRGRIPETLSAVNIERLSYVHIDMNVASPERDALVFVWPRLVPGAVIIFDDYGWNGHREQRRVLDDTARGLGASILELPTGQGMIVKGA